jgi:hypothetical protein
MYKVGSDYINLFLFEQSFDSNLELGKKRAKFERYFVLVELEYLVYCDDSTE